MAVEIVPAILCKDRADFERKLASVAQHVSRVQIDIMDGKFVPNSTLQPQDFPPIPGHLLVEYHLMVQNPLDYVRAIGRKGAIYELHVESLVGAPGKGGEGLLAGEEAQERVLSAIAEVKRMGGRVALALSPDTPVDLVLPYKERITHVLVMAVYPGFSGQKYLSKMEEKMRTLSSKGFVVEVDGGIEIGAAAGAARAGATLLNAASAIFSKPDAGKAIEGLKRDAEGQGWRSCQLPPSKDGGLLHPLGEQ